MFCKFCGKEIDVNSSFCPFCGQELKEEKEDIQINDNKVPNKKTSPLAIGCAVIGGIFIFLFIILPFMIGSSENSNTAATSFHCPSQSETSQAINEYKMAKIIGKFEPSLNSVYITTRAQNQLSIDDIQTLGYISACYSAYHKSTSLTWVDIYNYNTGKKIAHYSATYGFKMEK